MIHSDTVSHITPKLLAEAITHPAPLGLVFFGLTFLLFNICTIGIFPLSPLILALGILYGAAGQIFIGILEWRRNRAFSATAFTTFGLFWLSLIALTILPGTGYGERPEAAAMTAYFGIWCLFTGILLVGTSQLGRILQFVFAAFFLYLLLRTIGASGLTSFNTVAGYEGIFGGAAAIFAGIILAADPQTGKG